ncbi:MAG: FeS-binding protein, partial [Anaerolineae bacterium]|nr:FeS-binding protein [Anaerolineae bacterium]
MSNPKVAVVKTGSLKGNAEFLPPVKKYKRYDEDIDVIEAAVAEAVKLSVGSLDNLIKPGQAVL